MENNSIWNEAAKSGLVFGVFSSACLGLKELAALSESTFLIQAAAILLWAVEFFGCILLMKHCMLSVRDRYGAGVEDVYRFGRRTALLSGLILASVETVIILKMPPEALNEAVSTAALQLGASARDQMDAALDALPAVTFFAQWIYCFLYGTVLSSIMARYIFMQDLFQDGTRNDGNDNAE